MNIEEFCREGLIYEFSAISSFDDGNLRIDIDFSEEDGGCGNDSLIAHIYEVSYEDLFDEDLVEDYQLEEFEGFVYYLKCLEFIGSGCEVVLSTHYFDVDLLIEDIKKRISPFSKVMKSYGNEFFEVSTFGRLTLYDKDKIKAELDSFVEVAMLPHEQMSLF